MRLTLQFACAALLLPLVSSGQSSTPVKNGKLAGVVSDEHGKPLGGAVITAVRGKFKAEAKTDKAGGFTMEEMVPGDYDIYAKKEKYKTAVMRGVEVLPDHTSAMRFSLTKGSPKETVELVTDPCSVDTDSSSVTSVWTSKEAARVPIGRTVGDLVNAASAGGTTEHVNCDQ